MPTQQKSRRGHRRPGNRKILFAAGNTESTEVPTYFLFWLCMGFLEWVTKREIKKYSQTLETGPEQTEQGGCGGSAFSPGSIHVHTLKAFRGSEREAPRGKRVKRQTGKRLECPTLMCHWLV